MSDILDIGAAPYRSVWVFSVDLPQDSIDAFGHETIDDESHTWPLGVALGVVPFPDHDFVELIDLEALRSYGFSNYLAEANGMDLGHDGPSLDELTGHVVLVFSQGLETGQSHFAPQPPLTLIGRYSQPQTMPVTNTIESEAARGQLAQGKPAKSDARISGMVATFVLLFLAVFVVLFVWMAG